MEGWRLDATPQVGLSYVGAGYFLKPAVALETTQYRLQDLAPGVDDSPGRTLPIVSIDSGLQFERESGRRGQRRMTLEPRLMYLYVPYRDQSDLPIFDTAEPDLNWIELFRTNRYVGSDRISDANQLTAGFTHPAVQQRDRHPLPVDDRRPGVLFPHATRHLARRARPPPAMRRT